MLGPEMRSTGEVLGIARVLRAGLLQGPGGRQAAAARRGDGADQPRREERAGGRGRRASSRSSASASGPPRARRLPRRARHRGRADQQDPRRPAAHRRRHHQPRDPAGRQHARRPPQRVRRLVHPQDRDQVPGPLHHDAAGRARLGAGHRRLPSRRRRRHVAPGVPRAGSLAERASCRRGADRPVPGARGSTVRYTEGRCDTAHAPYRSGRACSGCSSPRPPAHQPTTRQCATG